jgi:hypothetical protein
MKQLQNIGGIKGAVDVRSNREPIDHKEPMLIAYDRERIHLPLEVVMRFFHFTFDSHSYAKIWTAAETKSHHV